MGENTLKWKLSVCTLTSCVISNPKCWSTEAKQQRICHRSNTFGAHCSLTPPLSPTLSSSLQTVLSALLPGFLHSKEEVTAAVKLLTSIKTTVFSVWWKHNTDTIYTQYIKHHILFSMIHWTWWTNEHYNKEMYENQLTDHKENSEAGLSLQTGWCNWSVAGLSLQTGCCNWSVAGLSL